MITTKYLIIGNSAGGISAAEAIRGLDSQGTLTIISDEPYPAYSRILITKYLAKERGLDKMLLRPADFYAKNNITFLSGRRVTRLILEQHIVETDDGEQITWDKLLLALGGAPIFPRIDGIDKKGIFTFTKLDDAKAIDEFMDGSKRAVVIGGGLIGVSATESLVKRGLKVTIVEMAPRVLSAMLDEYASSIVTKTLEDVGVGIATGHTVTRVIGNGKVAGAVLENGETIPCELVIVGIGVSPRLELVKGTQIKVGRGILVDRHMATNYPDVYACGDAAEAYDFVLGANRVVPIWPGAQVGGKIAGLNMAGNHIDYAGTTNMNTLNYFGLDIASAGVVVPPDDSYEVMSNKNSRNYQKIVTKDNKIVGMLFTGQTEKAGIILCMMREKMDISDLKQCLTSKNTSGLMQLLFHMRLDSLKCKIPPE